MDGRLLERDWQFMLDAVYRINSATSVDSLEREGRLERLPHPADRRRKLVSLTPAGREFAREVVETIFEKERIAMEVLTSEEQEQLLAMYGRLQHGFETSFLAEK